MAWPLAVAAVAAPIITGIMGSNAAKADRQRAEAAMNAALAEIKAVGAPPDLSREIILEKFEQQGILTPELEEEISIGFSQVSQIQEDITLRQAQTDALRGLQDRAQMGITAQERGDLNTIRREVAREAEARRQQVLQQMQARGLGGSGAELAGQLQASQAGAELASQEGDRIAAMAQRNALQAMTQAGQMGGQIRGQDFDVARAKAAAADEFRRFDVANQVAQQQRNIASKNIAAARNLAEKQRIADANVQQGNLERYRQQEARRQQWQDRLNQAQAAAGIRTGQSGFHSKQAGETANRYSQMGSGISGGLISAYGAGMFGGEQKKDTTG